MRQRLPPKGPATPDNPSVSLRLTAPFTQGSLWGRGMRIAVTSAPNFGIKFGWRWLRHRRVGPLGLLAMTTVFCHSEEQSDVGIRPFYDFTMDGGRGFGPPYLGHGLRRPNFVPKFGASVKSSAPTEGLPKSQQQADVVIGPYGKPNQPPKPAGAQRSVCGADGRKGWESTQGSSQKGDRRRDCPGSA